MTWATALDRFAHSVHRFHDRVEVIPDRALRRDLQAVGEALQRSLTVARSTARAREIPEPDVAQVVRDVMRAGTLCARAIEAAVAAATARRGGEPAEAARWVSEARSLADTIGELLPRPAPGPPD